MHVCHGWLLHVYMPWAPVACIPWLCRIHRIWRLLIIACIRIYRCIRRLTLSLTIGFHAGMDREEADSVLTVGFLGYTVVPADIFVVTTQPTDFVAAADSMFVQA